VTEAGCGIPDSCAAAVALSGAITNARDGDSATTSSSGPALGFQFLGGATAAESTGGPTFVTAESVRTGAFPRSHAAQTIAAITYRERRNRFI